MTRLPQGRQIDRSRDLAVLFDGRQLTAHPRGRWLRRAARQRHPHGRAQLQVPPAARSAGRRMRRAERPLVTIGSRAATPNVRATVQEVHEGTVATSQNRWPACAPMRWRSTISAAPLIGAGFYYKTFMWPRRFWERVYEPLIRRAAASGMSGLPDPDRSDKAFAFCDLLVIGAGPARLMAAARRARRRQVILADEDFRLGGRLNAERLEVGGRSGIDWAAAAANELAALPMLR